MVGTRVRILVGILFFSVLFASGCSLLPAKKEEPPLPAARLQALDQHAWRCYTRALDYMDQSRYELASQQFAFAASAAVSKSLYEDAIDGLRRSQQVITEKR